MFPKIEQDNCFIIQHIDNKAQFYRRKAGDGLPRWLLVQSSVSFFSPTHEIVYIAKISDVHERTMTIFGQCSNVFQSNRQIHEPIVL